MNYARRSIHSLMLIVIVCVGLSQGTAYAQEASVTVPLILLGSTTPDGMAVLTADGEGTRITVDIGGLAPNQTAGVVLSGGSCAAPGASPLQLPVLTADTQGHATMSGEVVFRGSEPIALRDIADGAHLISIGGVDGAVACGDVPRLMAASTEAPHTLLDANGGVERTDLLLLAAVVALAAMLAFLPRFRRRASH